VIKGISSNTNQYGRNDTAVAVSANGMRENQGQVLLTTGREHGVEHQQRYLLQSFD